MANGDFTISGEPYQLPLSVIANDPQHAPDGQLAINSLHAVDSDGARFGLLYADPTMAEAARLRLDHDWPNAKTLNMDATDVAARLLTGFAGANSLRGYALNWNPGGALADHPAGGTLIEMHELVRALIGTDRVDYTIGNLRFQFPLWLVGINSKGENRELIEAPPAEELKLEMSIDGTCVIPSDGDEPRRCVPLFTSEPLCQAFLKWKRSDEPGPTYIAHQMRSVKEAGNAIRWLCNDQELRSQFDGFVFDPRKSGTKCIARAPLSSSQMLAWLDSPHFRIAQE
jgi:hypothetical protein